MKVRITRNVGANVVKLLAIPEPEQAAAAVVLVGLKENQLADLPNSYADKLLAAGLAAHPDQ